MPRENQNHEDLLENLEMDAIQEEVFEIFSELEEITPRRRSVKKPSPVRSDENSRFRQHVVKAHVGIYEGQ